MKHPVIEINAQEESGGIEVRLSARRWAQRRPCTLNGSDLTRFPVAA